MVVKNTDSQATSASPTLQPFSAELVEPWRTAIERTPISPGPAGGPEYVATPAKALGQVHILRAGELLMPFVRGRVKHLGFLGSDLYEGVQTNSFLGVKSLDESSFAALAELPDKATVLIHVPWDMYRSSAERFEGLGYTPLKRFYYHKVTLSGSYDEWFMRHEIDRLVIRKAVKRDVTIAIGGAEFLQPYFDMYLASFQRWQRQNKAFWHHEYERFERMFKMPDSGVKIALARHDDKVIASGLICCYKRTAAGLYGGIDYRYRAHKASNLLYAEVIRYLIRHGFAEYNMGTSNDLKNVERFKQTLGGVKYRSIILCRDRYRRIKKVLGFFSAAGRRPRT